MSRSSAPLRLRARAAALLAWLAMPGLCLGQVTPVSPGTTLDKAPNGVQIVNIANADAAGVSKNVYSSFNVGAAGLVLNNATPAQLQTSTQLAGKIYSNLDLKTAASLILNEVNSNNRSTLAGFIEVAGQPAGVVVANPYGITCNGCGFINTPNVTLATGASQAGGNLSLLVSPTGDLLITGSGLNASAADYLALVSRKITLDGQVNAKQLDLIAGRNNWDPVGHTATPAAASPGDAPDYGVDSTVLGGVYANRIRVVATDAGVGVRMRGDAAVSGDDFTIDAQGQIALSGKVDAARNITLTTTAAGTAVATTDAQLLAKGDVTLTAAGGAVALVGGVVSAGGNASVTVASFTDTSSSAAITDVNKRYAASAFTIKSADTAQVSGVSYSAGAQLALTAKTLTLGGTGTTLYSKGSLQLSSSGDMALGTAAVSAVGDLTAVASGGAISTLAGAGGVQSSQGAISLTAANGLNNAGAITADGGALTIKAATVNAVSGVLHAKTSLSLTDAAGGASEALTNAGSLLSDGALSLLGAAAVNSGSIQGGSGATATFASLSNSGTFIAGADAGASGVLNIAASLTNSGVLQSAQALTVNAGQGVTNTASLITQTGAMTLEGAVPGQTFTVLSQGAGVIQSGGSLLIAGAGGGQDAVVTVSGGVLRAASGATINASTLANSGQIIASTDGAGAGVINATTLTNTAAGVLQSSKSLTVNATDLVNAGAVQAQSIAANLGGALTNSGKMIADAALTVGAASLTNSGALQGQAISTSVAGAFSNTGLVNGLTSVEDTSDTLQNSGVIQAANDVSFNLGTSLTNTANGKILGLASGNSSIKVTALSVTNNGLVQSGAALSLYSPSVMNTGFVNAAQNLYITALGSGSGLTNTNVIQAGFIALKTDGFFNNTASIKASAFQGVAGAFTNPGTIQVDGVTSLNVANDFTNPGSFSAGDLFLNATTVTNGGTLSAARTATFRPSAGALSITDAGRIQAGTTLDITASGTPATVALTGTGSLLGDVVTMATGALTLDDDAGITAGTQLAQTSASISMGGSNAYIVAGGSPNSTLTVAAGLTNPGAIFASGKLILTTPSLTNTATGGIGANDTLDLEVSGATNNYGSLYAAKQLTVNGGSFLNADNATVNGDQDAAFTVGSFTNNWDINIARDITITANVFHNDVTQGDDRHWNYEGTGFDPYNGGDCAAAGGPCGNTSGAQNYTLSNHQVYVGNLGGHYDNYSSSWSTSQSYASGHAPTHKAQILANNSLTVVNFSTGTNIGGLLSAPTITIGSNKSGATFTNDDMSLTTQTWSATFGRYTDCYIHGFGIDCDTGALGGYNKQITSTTSVGFGAGVYAGALTVTGVALSNTGSQADIAVARSYNTNLAPAPVTVAGTAANASTSAYSKSGSTTVGVAGAQTVSAQSGAGGVSAAAAATTATAASKTLTFGGLNLSLPTNPNGYYVLSKDPNAAFLVETNPRYVSGAALGSDYLEAKLGVDPETTAKRLGDASYENYLITQQIVAQTGNSVLTRGGTELAMMQSLMDNAVSGAGAAGLKYGVAPTAAQLAAMNSDFVWMVATVVQGQTVLAPVVYLSQATLSGVDMGAVMSADNTTLDVTSLTNSGGAIEGGKTLDIKSKGDITNTSGTIKGGDVTVASTEGSIVNQDYAATGATGVSGINKTASIQSTGTLSLDAAKDITVKGAEVSAGGDAGLKAGGNVTFDTVAQTVTSSTGSGNSATNVSDTKNLKSGLTVGGALAVTAGQDITLAGTDVKAKAASLDAGGDINVLARNDSHYSQTKSASSGVFSSSEHTVTDTSTTNVGSNLDIGGNLKTKSGGDTTIQGAQVNVAGNADIKTGGDLNILDGQNTSSHTVEDSSSGVGHHGNLYGSTVHTVADQHGRSVATNLNIGGNLNADVGGDMTVQGSNLNAKGDTTLSANSVTVLAGQNTDSHMDKTVETKFGIFLGADGQAAASGGGAKGEGKSAKANASAQASGEVDIDLMRSQTDITTTRDVTHTAANLSTGGNLTVNAKNDLRTVGSNLAAGNDVNLNATNQSFEAAQDVHETTHSQEKTSAGLYMSGTASAQGQASYTKKDDKTGEGGSAGSGSASGELQAGIRGAHSSASVTTGSTVAQVSSITAGGNINRNATGSITDVGTAIGAGGDLNQTAKTYNALAAQNTTYTTSSAESDEAKIGISAAAAGSASKGGGKSDGSGDASVGVAASFSQTKDDSQTGTSTAVVTNIKTGGNANLTSTDKTTLVGTNIASGGDTNITAGSLDYQAARNTQTATSSGASLDVSGRVGIVGSASVDLNAAVGTNSSTATNTQAVVGQVTSGGNLNVKTTEGDVRLEGTKINTTGDATLDSAGSVKFDAAHDTSSSHDQSMSVAVGVSASRSKGSSGGALNANVDVANANTSEDNAAVGSVNTGGNFAVKSAKDTTFTGTAMTVGGDAAIEAQGDVNFNAATSTQHSDSMDVGVGVGVSKTGKGKNSAGKEQQGESGQSLSANVGVGKADASEQTAASLQTGGGFSIKSGHDVNLQGTTLAAEGGGSIDAANDVNATTIQDTASALNVGVGVAVDRSETNKSTKDANGKDVAKSAQQKKSDGTAARAKAKTSKDNDKAMAANAKAAGADSASNLIAAAPDQSDGPPDNAALDKIMDDKAAEAAKKKEEAKKEASPEGKAQKAASDAAGKKVSQALADRKAQKAADAAKSPEQKAKEAQDKKDADRAKMSPEDRAKADKKDADAKTKADKKAADAQAKTDKKEADAKAKADKKAADAKAKEDAKSPEQKAKEKAAADKKQAAADKKAADAQAKADKKAADAKAKEDAKSPEQKAKDKAAADKKAADAKTKADKKEADDKAKADKKAKADEQTSKTTVGITQHEFSHSDETVVKKGSISGSGITINAGHASNLGGTTVSQAPAAPAAEAPSGGADSAGKASMKDLKSLSKTSSVSNAQAQKAISDKKAADAKKAKDKAAIDKAAADKVAGSSSTPPK